MIFKKISTLIVSKYHFILLTFVSCSSSSSFSTLRHIYSTISRSKDQFLSISLANNKIHSSIFFLPLFIPHSLLLSRRFLSNCPSLSLLFALFLFFLPPFLLPRNLPWRSCKRRIELDTPPDTDLLPEIGPLPLATE